jgi:hypothetical protein
MFKFENERNAILAVRKTIKSGLFKKDTPIESKREAIETLHKELCEFYNLTYKAIKWDLYRGEFMRYVNGGGRYNPITKEITLFRLSLVTYLHEFYHFMAREKGLINSEPKARGWSISLYFKATPKLCEAAMNKGLIIHQKIIERENENANERVDESNAEVKK